MAPTTTSTTPNTMFTIPTRTTEVSRYEESRPRTFDHPTKPIAAAAITSSIPASPACPQNAVR
jgi:hypothetical protein